jgi:hypothetical protein
MYVIIGLDKILFKFSTVYYYKTLRNYYTTGIFKKLSFTCALNITSDIKRIFPSLEFDKLYLFDTF